MAHVDKDPMNREGEDEKLPEEIDEDALEGEETDWDAVEEEDAWNREMYG